MFEDDAEARFNQVASRLPQQTVVVAVAPTTVPYHTHSSDQIGRVPSGNLEAVNDQVGMEELDAEKLAIDGSMEMEGALKLGHFSLVDVDDADIEGTATIAEDLIFSGGTGLARVRSPNDVEFKVSVVPGTDYTAIEGATSWDASSGIKQLVTHVSGSAGLVKITGTGVYFLCRNDTGTTVPSARAIFVVAGSAGTLGLALTQVSGAPDYDAVGGITLQSIADGAVGWVCVAGYAIGIDTSSWSVGAMIWAYEDGTLVSTTPSKGMMHLKMGSVITSDAAGMVLVCVEWIPLVWDLADVVISESVQEYDVLMQYGEGEDPVLWRDRPAAHFPSRSISSDDFVADKDVLMLCTAPLVLTLPADGAGRWLTVQYVAGSGSLEITSPSANIEGESSVFLVTIGESIDLRWYDGGWRIA